LQQLSKTPEGLIALPLSTQSSNIISVAVGDSDKGDYAVHIVNRGGGRPARLTGMDNSVEWMRYYITNEDNNLSEQRRVRVQDGKAEFFLPANSFCSLFVDNSNPFEGF